MQAMMRVNRPPRRGACAIVTVVACFAGGWLLLGCSGPSPPPPAPASDAPRAEQPKPQAVTSRDETHAEGWSEATLFRMFDIRENTNRGKASFSRQVLRFTSNTGACQVYFPKFQPPEEYDLEADVIRTEGSGSIIFGLYAWGRQCRVVIDGDADSGPRTGLAPMDGKWVTDPNYPGGLNGPVLQTGRQSTIVCRVRRKSLVVTCDGRTVVDFGGDPTKLGEVRSFGVPVPSALSVASWKCLAQIPRLVVRAPNAEVLIAAEKPVASGPSPAEAPVVASPAPARPTPTVSELTPGPPQAASAPAPPASPPAVAPAPTASTVPAEGTRPEPASSRAAAPKSSRPIAGLSPIAEKAQRSVALIQHPRGSGTGFVVGNHLVATAAHVVHDVFVDELELHFLGSGERSVRAQRVIYEDGPRDLCLLEAETDQPSLPVAADYQFQQMEPVFLLGNPSVGGALILRGATVEGRLAAQIRIESYEFYQMDAEVNPGSSGGPVLDHSGAVLAAIALKAAPTAVGRLRAELQRLDASLAQQFRGKSESGMAFGVPASALGQAIRITTEGSESQRDQANAAHEARTVVRRLTTLGGIYLLRIQANPPPLVRLQYEQLVRQGRLPQGASGGGKQGRYLEITGAAAAERLRRELDGDEVQNLQKSCASGMRARMERLAASPHLAQETRSDLDGLFRTIQQIAAFADSPPGNYQQFSARTLGFAEKVGDLVERLDKSVAVKESALNEHLD